MIIFVDTFSKEHIDPKKILITAFLSGILFINAIDLNSFYTGLSPNGDWTLFSYPKMEISFILLDVWTLLITFYYFINLVIKSPPKLKKYVFLIFGIAFVIGVAVITIIILGIFIIPGFDGILLSLTVALMTIIFAIQPKLFYVLPFKALRMTVLDTDSGSFLYDFQWDKK